MFNFIPDRVKLQELRKFLKKLLKKTDEIETTTEYLPPTTTQTEKYPSLWFLNEMRMKRSIAENENTATSVEIISDKGDFYGDTTHQFLIMTVCLVLFLFLTFLMVKLRNKVFGNKFYLKFGKVSFVFEKKIYL